MRPVAAVVVLVLLTLGSAPLAPAQAPAGDAAKDAARQASMVTIYPHVFAATANFPMPGNTQFPWGEDDFSAGYPGNGCYPAALAPLSAVPPVQGDPVGLVDTIEFPQCDAWTNNVLYVYSTAGFVHADFDTWSYDQFHNERGQAKEIFLDTTKDITSTFYMSPDWHSWGYCPQAPIVPGIESPVPCWNWDPGYFPQWQVEATLFLANMGEYQGQASEPPPVHAKIKSGSATLVAQGMSEPQDMVGLPSSVVGHNQVYEFKVNLGKPKVDAIPKEMDWVMRFRWWMNVSGNDMLLGQKFNWNINSGELYPNRFVLPVKNPFDVEMVYPRFLHDRLVILGILNSPWGSYDVDSKSVQLDITDDAGHPVVPQHISRVADFSVAHGGHFKPVNITWVWDYLADKLPPGTYKVGVTASNFQHSASATTEGRFRVNADGTGDTVEVGRSGQQTATQQQLQNVQGAGNGTSIQSAALQPLAPAGPALAPAAAALAFAVLAGRRRA